MLVGGMKAVLVRTTNFVAVPIRRSVISHIDVKKLFYYLNTETCGVEWKNAAKNGEKVLFKYIQRMKLPRHFCLYTDTFHSIYSHAADFCRAFTERILTFCSWHAWRGHSLVYKQSGCCVRLYRMRMSESLIFASNTRKSIYSGVLSAVMRKQQ